MLGSGGAGGAMAGVELHGAMHALGGGSGRGSMAGGARGGAGGAGGATMREPSASSLAEAQEHLDRAIEIDPADPEAKERASRSDDGEAMSKQRHIII